MSGFGLLHETLKLPILPNALLCIVMAWDHVRTENEHLFE